MKQYLLLVCMGWIFSPILFAQQTEYKNDDGIFYEIRQTKNNKVYQIDNTYSFSYQYITKEGEKLFYRRTMDWEFVSEEDPPDDAVTIYQMKVLPGVCNEVQSCIEFRYRTNDGEFLNMRETTGLIENEKNIWIHPPRSGLFRILEMNPFPFIQQPYEKGNKWQWSLQIGDKWGDPRWKEWNGTIENQYVYEIVDTESIMPTTLGNVSCYKIDSYAKSELGKTYLTAYFNEIYGFVRLEYINIDGSTLNIDLYKANIK